MILLRKIVNHLVNPRSDIKLILKKYGGWVPDSIYLRIMFFLYMGKPLHLRHPKTFSEKLQWLKLYNRKPEYTMMVDKYAVKDYVAKVIGNQYIIPTLGVWDRPDDIEWDKLPNQFVLKTTHGGGNKGVVICKDKKTFNKADAIDRLCQSLRQDIYRNFREWPYKNVKRRIMAEQFMENSSFSTDGLSDFKFFCFDGTPMYCQVISNRNVNETIDFFDMEWHHQDFVGLNTTVKNAPVCPLKPACFEEMKTIACKLADNKPFCRVDLYEIHDKTFFGEITFYPRSGFGRFTPDNYNEIIGNMISLPGVGGGVNI